MLIGICGGLCSGKNTIAQYLVEHLGFQRLYLHNQSSSTILSNPEKKESSGTTTTSPNVADTTTISASISYSPQSSCSLHFDTADELIAFVTKNWQTRYVITHIASFELLDQLSQRPFFLLIKVDAPLMKRYERYLARESSSPTLPSLGQSSGVLMDLTEFVRRSDEHLYHPRSGGIAALASRADITLLNTSGSVAHLYATLGRLALHDEERLRPSWDAYFMALAALASRRSNCMKRRVGCVLVKDRRVVATGYNGTPRGLTNCGDGGCPRCNAGEGSGVGLATCLCLHAEENALLEAGRTRISGGGAEGGEERGSILYCDTCPCLTCSIKIAQVGIKEVVYAQGYSMDDYSARVLGAAGVKLRQFCPPANGFIHLENLDLH